MFSNKKLKFQENISGAQITCHAQPDSNMKPRTKAFQNFTMEIATFFNYR